MAEKTIEELKKLVLVISKQYQEYKKVVAQLKHVLDERGSTIMKNKLEIFSLRKDGYSGPPEDEKFFRICHTIQMRLLESHTEAYYKDFKGFEKNIEKKFRMMATELERLQRLHILWDEKQSPVENMSKIIKKKEVEITALKQEMSQLFKQKQQDRMQINTLQQESKPTTEKMLLLKQTYEKERSIRRQIFEQLRQAKGDCKDLDAKLKTTLEEYSGLQEKYQKESSLHKTTKVNMKRLQGGFEQVVQEKNCLQTKCEKDEIKSKLMKEASDKTIEELQIQLKDTVKEHKLLEKSYEKEKFSHNDTKETLNQVIKDLQGQLHELIKEHNCLEKNYTKEKCSHKITKEALNQVIEEQERKITTTREELEQAKKELNCVILAKNMMAKNEEKLKIQLENTLKEKKILEENYKQEMSQLNDEKQELEQSIKKIELQLKKANEQHTVMCKTIEELEVNLKQAEEKIISLEETHRKEVDAHEMTKENLSQTQEQLDQADQQNKEMYAKIIELELRLEQTVEENKRTNENYQEEMSAHKHTEEQLNHFEEFYEKEKTEHRITREELEQCVEKAKELHVRIKEVEKGNLLLEERYQKEKSDLKSMTDRAEELVVLLKDTMEKNKSLEANWKQESSHNQSLRKELEEVQDQNRVRDERIQQLEDQLQRAAEENKQIQEKHVTETSVLRLQLQRTLEDLDQATSEKKIMEEKLKEMEELGVKEQSNQDQIQSQEKQFVKDLQACMSVISDAKKLKKRIVAMKRCYLENEHAEISEIVEQVYLIENKDLSMRLQDCQNLVKANSDTISRLERELSDSVQQCDEREKKYVQLINGHIVKEHQLKKEVEKTLLKLERLSTPISKRVSGWWQDSVLKKRNSKKKDAPNLYPEDWRLPK